MDEGWSAEQKAQELAASGDASARAWAAGADGERRVGAELSTLPAAWTVLHDRLLRPGQSAANLDHVVVGPAGLVLVDAKNWSGSVTAWDGGLFQHLGPSGARTSHSKHAEVAKVHSMAMAMAVETGMPVTSVICLAGASEATFGEPQCIRGVWVVALSQLVAWLRSRPLVLQPDDVVRLSTRAMTSFPSTTTDPDLLAAIGAAASVASPPRRRPLRAPSAAGGAQRRPKRVSQVRARRPMAARIGRLIGRAFLIVLVLSLSVALVPKLLGVGIERLAGGSSRAAPSADSASSGAQLARAGHR